MNSCKKFESTNARDAAANSGCAPSAGALPPLEVSSVRWEYEDELPEMEDDDFDVIFKASRLDGVRLYPFVEDSKGNRIWITNLSSEVNDQRSEPPTRNDASNTKDGSGTFAAEHSSEVHSELISEKKSHDETIEILKSNTKELNAACDHIKLLEACLAGGLEEHAALARKCAQWEKCAEALARELIQWGEFTGNTETNAALAEFESMKRRDVTPNNQA